MNEALRTLTPIIAVFVILVGGLMWAFDGMLESRNNPNSDLVTGMDAGANVVLTRNPYGQYIAPGSINGQKVTFLVDTGADHVAVPGNLAAALGLQRGRAMQVNTAGGQVTAYRTQIERISLGGIQLRDIRGSINPAMSGDEVLLGGTFLRHVDFQKIGDQLIIEPGQR